MTDHPMKPEDRALIELNPCAHCGQPDPSIVGHPDAPKGKVFIGCETCGARSIACEKVEHAARFWNRRSGEAPPVEAKPAEEVIEAVARIIEPAVWDGDEGGTESWRALRQNTRERALAKADAILALIPARDEAADKAAYMRGWNDRENEFLGRASMILPEGSFDEAALPAPVAWRYRWMDAMYGELSDWDVAPSRDAAVALAGKHGEVAPLYAHPATGTDELPGDVVRLVKASREEKLAGIIRAADDDGVEAIFELFAAANDFASRVPLEKEEGL